MRASPSALVARAPRHAHPRSSALARGRGVRRCVKGRTRPSHHRRAQHGQDRRAARSCERASAAALLLLALRLRQCWQLLLQSPQRPRPRRAH
eukprot:2220892-Prymnesium_polylepis.1